MRPGGYKSLLALHFRALRLLPSHQGCARCISSTRDAVVSNKSCIKGDEPRPKTFEQIAREMAERSARARSGPKARPIRSNFSVREVRAELAEPVQVGDLVLLNLDPAVVLRTPKTSLDNYVLVNQVGLIKEVHLNQIDARLMPLVPKKLLLRSDVDLYARDGSIAAPLGILSDSGEEVVDSSNEIMTRPLEKSTGRVVSWWVYRLISNPLRQVYEQATARAHEILPAVLRNMRALQSAKSPKPMPFLAFVESMLRVPKSKVSVLDFYAVRMSLEHFSLEYKFLLDLAYTGSNAILIMPEKIEQRNVQAQSASGHTERSYLLDYARNNLPRGVCEARAIELFRKKFPRQEHVNSAVAAELLKLPRGGLYGNLWTDWIFEAGENSRRAEALLQGRRNDILASRRRVYSQPVYCIDGVDAKEIDDGISLEQVSSNVYKLGIHIANPSAYFDIKSALSSILPLTSSTYLHDNRVIPMLPAALIESANLRADHGPKSSLSLFVEFDTHTNKLLGVTIEPLTLVNLVNLTYDEVDAHKQPFDKYYKVAVELLKARHHNDAFAFKNYVDDDLFLLGMRKKRGSEVIVSEFMILANRLVAEFCSSRDIPVWYRRQNVQIESPELEAEFSEYKKANGSMLGLSWRSLVTRSTPSVVATRHSGLGADMTTRFTSPLRRLEDLVTHTQLEAHLLGENLPFSKADLHELSDWLQLSQVLSTRLMRVDADIEQYAQLKPGMEVEGIVLPAKQDGQPASFFLPKFGGILATYGGQKDLRAGGRHSLKVMEVSSAGRYATVTLKSGDS